MTMRPALACIVVAWTLGCARGPGPESLVSTLPAPARPEDCRALGSSEELTRALAGASPGASFCLAPGSYPGPLTLPRGVTLWGPRSATIRSAGAGTTVSLDGARLLGVTVDGSGGRFEMLDAAVHVTGADARVEGVAIRHALFGILVDKARAPVLRGNDIEGSGEAALGLRGDAVRVWETTGGVIEDNLVRRSRDVVVWYSSGNVLRRNRIEGGRYGAHLMYSHENRVEANRFTGNVVGLFVMYSRKATIVGNVMAASSGAAGMGLGLKDSGDLVVRANTLVRNTVGLYVDTSPSSLDEVNTFEGNRFLLGQTAVVFHGSERRNVFRGNELRDNLRQVQVEGGADALGTVWEGNSFDDYAGYDLDGDGVGDVPYRLRSLSAQLVERAPALEFFRGTPALALVEALGHVAPLFEPRTLLVDPRPLSQPPTPEPAHEG